MAGLNFDDLIPKDVPKSAPQKGGLSFDDLIPVQAAPDATPPSNGAPGWANTLNSFGEGIVNAATLGFGDELGAAADYAGSHILPWRDPKTYDQALADTRGEAKQTAADHPIANIAGNVTGAVGSGLGLSRAGLSMATRAANAGRGLGVTSLASAADGAILGGAQGFGQGEGGIDNRLDSAGNGAFYGGIVGAALPGVVSGVTGAVRRAITPFTATPERQALTDILANEGVDVTAGQATGSNALRYAESEIGGQTARDIAERQGEQFTSAALRRAGANANRATPDIIDANFNRIGQQFDDLAARNNLVPDNQLAHDLGGTWREYASLVPESQRAPGVADMINDLGQTLGQGPLDGAAYQAARSRLDRMARSSARDPQLQNALFGIRNALDDGMQRTIAQTNPQDLGAWQQVRRQYRNMLTLERAVTGAGENAAQGLISPSALRNATVTTQGRRAYARGTGDFADLARAGEGVMKPMPNSGTAGRLRAQNIGAGASAIMGAVAGTHVGGPEVGLAAGAAGAIAPQIVGRLMMTGAGQAYLRNQLLSGALRGATRAQIVAALNALDAQALPKLLGGEGN